MRLGELCQTDMYQRTAEGDVEREVTAVTQPSPHARHCPRRIFFLELSCRPLASSTFAVALTAVAVSSYLHPCHDSQTCSPDYPQL